MAHDSPSLPPEPRRTAPPGGGNGPYKGEAERQRLLRRLQADALAAAAAVAAVKAESQRLLDAEAQRPLTAQERERTRALRQESRRLWFEMPHLRTELAALQRGA